jgi:hypothetical protein
MEIPEMSLSKRIEVFTVWSVTEADRDKEAVDKLCTSGLKAHPAGSKCDSGQY